MENTASQPAIKHRRKHKARRYTEPEKLAIAALLKSGKSIAAIARENKIPPSSIYNVKANKKYEILEASKVEEIKRSLVGMTYANAHRAQSFITDDKLNQASALQLMTISAIGIDKGRLMEGLSTENIAKLGDQCDSEIEEQLKGKRAELERIRNAKVIEVVDQNAPNQPITSTLQESPESASVSMVKDGNENA